MRAPVGPQARKATRAGRLYLTNPLRFLRVPGALPKLHARLAALVRFLDARMSRPSHGFLMGVSHSHSMLLSYGEDFCVSPGG